MIGLPPLAHRHTTLFLTAERFDAQTAFHLGLVQTTHFQSIVLEQAFR